MHHKGFIGKTLINELMLRTLGTPVQTATGLVAFVTKELNEFLFRHKTTRCHLLGPSFGHFTT
jgi:hypothetical protein